MYNRSLISLYSSRRVGNVRRCVCLLAFVFPPWCQEKKKHSKEKTVTIRNKGREGGKDAIQCARYRSGVCVIEIETVLLYVYETNINHGWMMMMMMMLGTTNEMAKK